MLCYGEIKTALLDVTKECHSLWEENKEMQARFVNDLTELHRIQLAVNQLENDHREDKLTQARASMSSMQQRASQLYSALMEKRCSLTQKLNDGVHNIAVLQNQLISECLYDWKNRQKLQQVGVSFERRDQLIDEIQAEFELLAEQNWQLRTYACWQMDLLRRGPQMNGQMAQTHVTNLNSVLDNLTKLLCMLVSQSFVVAVQPEPVLKTQHKFFAEVRLLIGDKLGIKQHLVNTNVTVRIIAEEEARLLSTAQLSEKDVKTVGSISNDFEKMTTDDKGHMSAKFSNSKLTRIAHRKPPPKGGQGDAKVSVNLQTATDQKYALLFHITPFQLGNLGKFDVWTLSLPIMVTVHGSQDCDAQGAVLWQRAFSDVNRTSLSSDIGAVSWRDLSQVLRHKFAMITGAERIVSDSDLSYMAEKLNISGDEEKQIITLHRFAKVSIAVIHGVLSEYAIYLEWLYHTAFFSDLMTSQPTAPNVDIQNLRDDVNFSFWEWFFAIMQLIKHKLLKFWNEGWLIGFISKQDASSQMVSAPHLTFLLRFSDTQTGAVSIGFVCDDEDRKVPFHLSPFSIKDLDQLSLAQRIASCPQLKDIKYLYPDIDKDDMLRYFESEERQKSLSPTGYIQSEIVMVAKTGGKTVCPVGGDSPLSSLSAQTKLDWSPGETFARTQSTEIIENYNNEEVISILSISSDNDIEALLGPGFYPQFPNQPLQLVDLSHVHDSSCVQKNSSDSMEE